MTYHAQALSENTATLVGMSGDFTFTTAATPQDITPPEDPAIDTLLFSPPDTVAITWLPFGSGYVGHRLYDSDDGGATWSLVLDESVLTSAKTSEIATPARRRPSSWTVSTGGIPRPSPRATTTSSARAMPSPWPRTA
jgi:hypothetical protein